ncbi:ras association domain-containing protein 8-like [Cololabis saira]|uniref:ras association domain-containing protein 8-like n=1 Tax=Cololabis saira TaxID=129043 RepID=UPI002AD51415|nr:ras association domain-containing protein 8-like [Cololabis saira]XP_061564710.1 ras association domain-containing protein 8-like [Cololabis saira]XP_061564718.1 ras association domain-containing protein 8-like [Cololabis saira]
MELKVWVEGVVRVVSGLSLDTSCHDVVIALAQAIGQTGRYVLLMQSRGHERRLVADDCPLQHLAQLGRLAAEVQFILRRTGPVLSEGPHARSGDKRPVLLRPSEPEPPKHMGLQKAFTFNLGPSTGSKRSKSSRDWSPSPRASPEPRASPVSFVGPPGSAHIPTKEEVFRQILEQQRRLQGLELHVEALERETAAWEQRCYSPEVSYLSPSLAEEVAELEQRLRGNELELTDGDTWEEELQAELDQERAMHSLLQQAGSSLEERAHDIHELQSHSAHLEKELDLEVQRWDSPAEAQQRDEALRSLTLELQSRRQLGEELEAAMSETQLELQTSEDRAKDRLEMMEEVNKELRQCNLQQFIRQTGGAPTGEQTDTLPLSEVYLSNAGIME